MTRGEMLRSLEDLLEEPAGSLSGAELLGGLDKWNSLAMMGFMALVDERLGVTVSPRKFAACSTVDDLLSLVPLQ